MSNVDGNKWSGIMPKVKKQFMKHQNITQELKDTMETIENETDAESSFIKDSNVITQESLTEELSLKNNLSYNVTSAIPESEFSFNNNSLYCDRTLHDITKERDYFHFKTIMPSMPAGSNCVSQLNITECSSSLHTDTDRTTFQNKKTTISLPIKMNHTNQNLRKLVTQESFCSDLTANVTSTKNESVTDENLFSWIQYMQTADNDTEILSSVPNGNKPEKSYSAEYQDSTADDNARKNIEKLLKDRNFDNNALPVSLPVSPQDTADYTTLPANVLLSNYCCAYSRGYTKKDLKPSPYRNFYSKVIQPLKTDFDKFIPVDQSLKSFFKAPEKTFEQVEDEVHKAVDNILFMLDENISEERD